MNKTKIKTRKILNKKILFPMFFVAISLAIGFLIAKFGKGISYIEENAILYLITFFGFSLTATVFIYQSLNKDIEESKYDQALSLIKSLSKSLTLTLILIICTIIFDFIISVIDSNNAELTNLLVFLSTIKYAMIIYAIICQIDILYSFVIIMCNHRKR